MLARLDLAEGLFALFLIVSAVFGAGVFLIGVDVLSRALAARKGRRW